MMSPSTPELCNKFLELDIRWSEQKRKSKYKTPPSKQNTGNTIRQQQQQQNTTPSIFDTPRSDYGGETTSISLLSPNEEESVYERLYRTDIKHQKRHHHRRRDYYYDEPIASLELRLAYNPPQNRLLVEEEEMTTSTTMSSSCTTSLDPVFERLYRNEYNFYHKKERRSREKEEEEVQCQLKACCIQTQQRTSQNFYNNIHSCRHTYNDDQWQKGGKNNNNNTNLLLQRGKQHCAFCNNNRKHNNKQIQLVTNSNGEEIFLGNSNYNTDDDTTKDKKKSSSYGVYMSHSTGCTYAGEIFDNLRHGYGILKETNGNMYCGNFRNGKKNGLGTWTLISDDDDEVENYNNNKKKSESPLPSSFCYYHGNFQNDVFHGKGTIKERNGTIYVGEWIEGEKNGNGVETTSGDDDDGQIYNGEFKHGQKHGLGTLTKSDGTMVYTGMWECNKPMNDE